MTEQELLSYSEVKEVDITADKIVRSLLLSGVTSFSDDEYEDVG